MVYRIFIIFFRQKEICASIVFVNFVLEDLVSMKPAQNAYQTNFNYKIEIR